jgi:DNA-binding NtrC family response regulator
VCCGGFSPDLWQSGGRWRHLGAVRVVGVEEDYEPVFSLIHTGAPPLVALDVVERKHIKAVLKRTGFHKSRTAEIIGISRKTLERKIVEFGLNAGRAE